MFSDEHDDCRGPRSYPLSAVLAGAGCGARVGFGLRLLGH